ncbi:MAG: hypothetical protein KF683_10960 [Rubrivivax sp.]|nr:hypothetical protein [Rubrivivax sp.]
MRVLLIQKDSDAKALLKAAGGEGAESLAKLQRLNPHLDLRQLAPGSVVLLPADAAAPSRTADVQPLGGGALAELQALADAAVAASAERGQQAQARAKADEQALAAALRGKLAKEALDRDPELAAQAAAAQKAAKDAGKAVATRAKQLETLTKSAQAELVALAKRLG